MRNRIIILLVIGLVALIAIGYYMYNKPHINVATTRADYAVSSDSLFIEYQSDEMKANTKYLEKIIEVTGIVQETDLENAAEPNVILMAADGEGTVTCGFKPSYSEKIKAIQSGNKLKIKGQCKGLTSDASLDLLASPDVVLTNCTILDK